MKKIKSLIYNIIFFIFYYFIKLISLFIKIRLLEIETRAIGHISEPIEVHILENKIGINKNFYLDIYFGQDKVANEFLWNKWKKILNLKFSDKIKRKIFKPVFNIAIKKKDNKILIPYRHHYFISQDKSKLWQSFDLNNVLKKNPPLITFSNHEKKIATDLLKKVNISEKDNIILLCNRDPYYRTNFKKNIGEIKYGHRDQKIDDYELGVKYLCDLNYKVIRMGKNMHQKLNVKHENFFDYAFSEIKNDLLDIFLNKICKFVISSQTGIESVASLFRKEIFFVNYNEFHFFHNFNYNIIYPKKFFYKKNGKELNIFEIYKDIVSEYPKNNYEENGIFYKNLNQDEILNAFKEIIYVFENGKDEETLKINNNIKNKVFEKTGLKYNFLYSKQYLKSQA